MMKRRGIEKKNVKEAVNAFHVDEDIPSDVQGSYTGTADHDSHPVQDADDL